MQLVRHLAPWNFAPYSIYLLSSLSLFVYTMNLTSTTRNLARNLTEIYAHNGSLVNYRNKIERKKCGSLKICRLFLGCTDYRMSNERYVMYFWEGFKMHTLFCAPLSAGFHRPIGVGWSLERQHLFSREGLPLFHLHSRLLSLPLLPGLRLASFSKALVDRTADRKIIATLIFFLLPFCSD